MRYAARRDASWYTRPNCYSVKRVHMIGKDGLGSQCGRCAVLDVDHKQMAQTIPEISRCRKCVGWPDFNPTPHTIHWT